MSAGRGSPLLEGAQTPSPTVTIHSKNQPVGEPVQSLVARAVEAAKAPLPLWLQETLPSEVQTTSPPRLTRAQRKQRAEARKAAAIAELKKFGSQPLEGVQKQVMEKFLYDGIPDIQVEFLNAVVRGDYEAVLDDIKYWGDEILNAKFQNGANVLMCAVAAGCKDQTAMKYIIEAKPGLLQERDNSERTALMYAAIEGQYAALISLFGRTEEEKKRNSPQIEIDAQDKDGNTALMLLIQNVDKKDQTEATIALAALLDKSDLTLRNNRGQTAGDIAAEMGVTLLSDKGLTSRIILALKDIRKNNEIQQSEEAALAKILTHLPLLRQHILELDRLREQGSDVLQQKLEECLNKYKMTVKNNAEVTSFAKLFSAIHFLEVERDFTVAIEAVKDAIFRYKPLEDQKNKCLVLVTAIKELASTELSTKTKQKLFAQINIDMMRILLGVGALTQGHENDVINELRQYATHIPIESWLKPHTEMTEPSSLRAAGSPISLEWGGELDIYGLEDKEEQKQVMPSPNDFTVRSPPVDAEGFPIHEFRFDVSREVVGVEEVKGRVSSVKMTGRNTEPSKVKAAVQAAVSTATMGTMDRVRDAARASVRGRTGDRASGEPISLGANTPSTTQVTVENTHDRTAGTSPASARVPTSAASTLALMGGEEEEISYQYKQERAGKKSTKVSSRQGRHEKGHAKDTVAFASGTALLIAAGVGIIKFAVAAVAASAAALAWPIVLGVAGLALIGFGIQLARKRTREIEMSERHPSSEALVFGPRGADTSALAHDVERPRAHSSR